MTATVVTPRPADPAISLPFRLLARNMLPDSVVRSAVALARPLSARTGGAAQTSRAAIRSARDTARA